MGKYPSVALSRPCGVSAMLVKIHKIGLDHCLLDANKIGSIQESRSGTRSSSRACLGAIHKGRPQLGGEGGSAKSGHVRTGGEGGLGQNEDVLKNRNFRRFYGRIIIDLPELKN